MKVTKFEHAFVVLSEGGAALVIDPGKFSPALPELDAVAGVVLTHEHDDHTYAPHIAALRDRFPALPVWGTAASVGVLRAAGIDAIQAEPGQQVSAGPFRIAFSGGRHAVIHSSIPRIDNLAVAVNEQFYYAGDSFALPQTPVEILAVPSSAPWLKASEVIDYVLAVRPRLAFPTHDALWSEAGTALANARIGSATAAAGGRFVPLRPGESVEV